MANWESVLNRLGGLGSLNSEIVKDVLMQAISESRVSVGDVEGDVIDYLTEVVEEELDDTISLASIRAQNLSSSYLGPGYKAAYWDETKNGDVQLVVRDEDLEINRDYALFVLKPKKENPKVVFEGSIEEAGRWFRDYVRDPDIIEKRLAEAEARRIAKEEAELAEIVEMESIKNSTGFGMF